jgi:general secretion pathway protein D
VTISGVTEPIISQRVAEQVIQLKDGEPSLLAGILTNQDTKSVTGTPGLGELPILKYFFSSQDKVQQSDEIVFLLIPHIVRESILTDQNTRAIYTGTSQAVELIRNAGAGPVATPVSATPERNSAGETSAANAAAAVLPQIAAAAQPPTAPGVNPAVGAATAAGAGASVAPLSLSVVTPAQERVGATFQATVQATNAHDLFGVPLQIQFDPKVLQLVNVDAGELLGRDGQAVALVHRDEGNGAVTISATRPPNTSGVSGQGALCTLTFKAIAPGSTQLALVRIGARDSHQNNLPAVGTQATVQVTDGAAAKPPAP